MILDAHHHLWKYVPQRYPWITDEMAVIRSDFLPYDLWRELSENGVDGSIVVQARESEGETSMLVDLADRNDFIRGVVGWVDLCSPYLPDRLEVFGACPKLKGFRHPVQAEKDDQFLLRKDFCRGISMLETRRLTYDLLIFPQQLPAAIRFADQFPNLTIILDHLAKPLIRDRVMEPWETNIREIGRRPNMYCKLSGMVTEADWKNWKAEDLIPYMDIILDSFGPNRLLFGSDWPVCLVAAPYSQVLGLVKEYTSKLSRTEQSAILGLNAVNCYNLLAN